jgi:hypothetical protein
MAAGMAAGMAAVVGAGTGAAAVAMGAVVGRAGAAVAWRASVGTATGTWDGIGVDVDPAPPQAARISAAASVTIASGARLMCWGLSPP